MTGSLPIDSADTCVQRSTNVDEVKTVRKPSLKRKISRKLSGSTSAAKSKQTSQSAHSQRTTNEIKGRIALNDLCEDITRAQKQGEKQDVVSLLCKVVQHAQHLPSRPASLPVASPSCSECSNSSSGGASCSSDTECQVPSSQKVGSSFQDEGHRVLAATAEHMLAIISSQQENFLFDLSNAIMYQQQQYLAQLASRLEKHHEQFLRSLHSADKVGTACSSSEHSHNDVAASTFASPTAVSSGASESFLETFRGRSVSASRIATSPSSRHTATIMASPYRGRAEHCCQPPNTPQPITNFGSVQSLSPTEQEEWEEMFSAAMSSPETYMYLPRSTASSSSSINR